MQDLLKKCTLCQALVDEEDLFCANCGREAPHEEEQADRASRTMMKHQFDCSGCGASMSYDASAQNLRCPFCGSERLEAQADRPSLQPQGVAPFRVSQAEANTILRRELGSGFWRPSDLADRAVVTKMAGVYVPFWVFSATTHTYWTADTSRTPSGARGDWFPLWGEHQGRYDNLLVGASGSLTPHETSAVGPFDLSAAVAPGQVDLDNAIVERFRVQRKFARPLARDLLESEERKVCSQYVPDRHRNVKVNVRLHGMHSRPMLLPVWILAYEYQGEVFRYVINGQSGKPFGRRPFSYKKLFAILGIAALAGVGILLCAGLAAALGGR